MGFIWRSIHVSIYNQKYNVQLFRCVIEEFLWIVYLLLYREIFENVSNSYKIERSFCLQIRSINFIVTRITQNNMSAYSLYIPGVYANITEAMIKNTFERMKIGKVNRAILTSQSSNKHNKAYVYFDELYTTSTVTNMLDEIKNGSSKLFYARTPHVYWVLLENRRPIGADELNTTEVEEVVVEEPLFTEEEEAFVPEEDTSLVSSDYAAQLEYEVAALRNQNAQLQYNSGVMFEHYNQLLVSNTALNYQVTKWRHLFENNQTERLQKSLSQEFELEAE